MIIAWDNFDYAYFSEPSGTSLMDELHQGCWNHLMAAQNRAEQSHAKQPKVNCDQNVVSELNPSP